MGVTAGETRGVKAICSAGLDQSYEGGSYNYTRFVALSVVIDTCRKLRSAVGPTEDRIASCFHASRCYLVWEVSSYSGHSNSAAAPPTAFAVADVSAVEGIVFAHPGRRDYHLATVHERELAHVLRGGSQLSWRAFALASSCPAADVQEHYAFLYP